MSTTYLSVHDLLRVAYTYESKAIEARYSTKTCSSPDICANLPTSPSSFSGFAAQETDFTQRFMKRNWKRDSVMM